MMNFLKRSISGLVLLFSLHVSGQEAQYIPGDVMVMLEYGAAPEQLAEDLRTINGVPTGLRVATELSSPMRTWLFQFDHGTIPQHVMLKHINAHRSVLVAQNNHVVKERVVPNDPQYGQQWHHQNIQSESAWDVSTGGVTATGDTIVVCIIERADLPHPDLIANAWYNHGEIPDNNIDDDDNGYIDDHQGWNPPNNNDNVYGGSHGTQVAGMIGATGDNSLGVAGANWDVKMMVVNYGGVQEAQVVAAYTYPLIMRRLYNETNGEQGAFVVATNASWGIDGGQPSNAPIWCAMYDTLGAAGILNCGATSNQNVNVDVVGDLPTACPSEFMVSVTATNNNDIRTFSAYGATHVDVGAPGEDVLTTNLGGGYGTTSGTSFASPLTAGVIGLLYSAPCASMMSLVHGDPAAGALFVRDALFNGVDEVGNLGGQTVTGGRINASNSMDIIMGSCGSCPAPYGLAADMVQEEMTSASLSWNSLSGSSFNMRYRPVGTTEWTEVNGINGMEVVVEELLICAQYEFQVMAICDGEESAYSSSFTWTSEGCCEAPPDLTVADVNSEMAQVVWNTVLAAGNYDLRYRVAGSPTWTTIPALEQNAYTIEELEGCTDHEMQVRSNCDGVASEWSATVEFTTTGCGSCVDMPYCASISDSSQDEFIAVVSIGPDNFTSGNDGGYGDHTSHSFTLLIGQSYTITLTPGYTSQWWAYDEHFRVYIDLDQNGNFTGAGELVYDAPTTTNESISGQITIPTSAVEGSTRMRVVMRYDQPVDGPCADYPYGETEDYCLDLVTTATAITEQEQGTGIKVYPDPADRDIFIDIDGELAGSDLSISVLDQTGREVARKAIRNGRATVTTAFLANGMYVYRILHGSSEVGRGKFIVAHL